MPTYEPKEQAELSWNKEDADASSGAGEHPHYWMTEVQTPALSKALPVGKRKKAYFDIETSGLAYTRQCIIEVALYCPEEDLEWSSKVAVSDYDIARFEQGAIDVTGFNPKEWEGAPPLDTVLSKFAELAHGKDLVGHNISEFDIPWLNGRMEGIGIRGFFSPSIKGKTGVWNGPRLLDTRPMVELLFGPLKLKKHSLDACLELLGLEREADHRALGGAKACARMCNRIAEILHSQLSLVESPQ